MIRVLVVDDSKFIANLIKALLEENGFEVVGMGHDGQQGLDKFMEYRPDVMLLDVTMPNMCGVECLTRVKEFDGNARVVMHSAIQDQDTVDKCLEIGAASFLRKPIRKDNQDDLNRLKEAIQNAVACRA